MKLTPDEKKLLKTITSSYLEQLSIKAMQTALYTHKQNCFAKMKECRELLAKLTQ